MADSVLGVGRLVGRVCAVAVMLLAVSACGDGDGTDRTPVPRDGSPVSVDPPSPPKPFYLAVLARPREVYPTAGMDGVFGIRNGCAMMGDSLLVLPAGSALVENSSGTALRLASGELKLLAPGYRITGGGGAYPIGSLGRADNDLELVEPLPARCASLAREAALVAPVENIMPPSRYADRLYAAVQRQNLTPPTLAPVSGTLGVIDQCLTLGGRLVALPAGSSVEFAGDGTLNVRIASSRYLETVTARPGDTISGTGAGLGAETGELPAMPRPLLDPIPPRCRKIGRGGVLLNPGPTVTRAGKTA